MPYILQLSTAGDVGEWEIANLERARRAFGVFKRRATLWTARDGRARTVKLLELLETLVATPAEPSESEIAAFDQDVADRFE